MSNYRKLQKFYIDNPELVSGYESLNSVIPLEICENDIIDSFTRYSKINKFVDFDKVLEESFNIAIHANISLPDAVDLLMTEESSGNSGLNLTQQYFKEVNDIYNRYNNDYDIEYCPENRNKLIEMNLKSVISIAKKYQGLGLSLNELISAGNLGLVIAYDKFDPSRSKLKDNIMCIVDELPDQVTFEFLSDAIESFLKYGDIKKKFLDTFQEHDRYISKKDVIKWVNSNIFNAKFSSIANMWIRAYILIEIDKYSRIVKKPKSEIYKDKLESGSYQKEIMLNIDAPISNNSNTPIGDMIIMDDSETDSVVEVNETYDIFKNELAKLLTNVKTRDRSIFLKKFGIGLPRPLLPKEIAQQEGLSIARVSQIFQQVLETIQVNQAKYNVDANLLFDLVRKLQ